MATTTHRPADDALATFIAGSPVDTAGDRYQNIDESSLNETDYIYYSQAAVGAGLYRARTTVAAGEMAGRTITNLKGSWWVRNNFAAGNRSFTEKIRIGSTDYDADHVVPAADSVTVKYNFTWTTNPATGLAWTATEIEAFRVGGSNSIGIDLESNDNVNPTQIVMFMMEVVVTWETAQQVGMIPILS